MTSRNYSQGVLHGIPASPGIAVGPARIVHDQTDLTRVQPGDILVCRGTSPAWTPLFAIIAGVVTELGTPISHAAIVAREHDIPAVVGATGALTRLTDGGTVRIDGQAGTIDLVD